MVYTPIGVLEKRVRRSHDVNARERVRLAIRERLSQIGMTGRAFGRAFSANGGKGHVDTWVSGLLNGQFALSLEELDEAAHILKTRPSELVRGPNEQAAYLTPIEAELLEDVRALPPIIRGHVETLCRYLRGVSPEEIEHLEDYRDLTADERARVQHWTRALLIAREPLPALAVLPDLPARDAPPDVVTPRTHRGRKR